ncbi:hypothetical protein KUCAC02_035977 [Chaenocephalus aceratus]|nr:hypothetical protein KUCAC02_035977 [Chaenocephalus aceratus]
MFTNSIRTTSRSRPWGGHGVHVHLRTITLNTEDGNFSVSMLLFKDEAFEDRWTTVPSLRLEDHVFVKVFMYTFIRDSCPVISSVQTLSVLRNGEGPDAAFRLQMFKFVGSSYTNVFLPALQHPDLQPQLGAVPAELFLGR